VETQYCKREQEYVFYITCCAIIYASNVIRVAKFYCEILGFEERFNGLDHILLEIPGFQLVIHSIPPLIAEMFEITDPPLSRDDSTVRLVFYIPSIHAIRQASMNLEGDSILPKWSGCLQVKLSAMAMTPKEIGSRSGKGSDDLFCRITKTHYLKKRGLFTAYPPCQPPE
jgi:hypothetical protein